MRSRGLVQICYVFYDLPLLCRCFRDTYALFGLLIHACIYCRSGIPEIALYISCFLGSLMQLQSLCMDREHHVRRLESYVRVRIVKRRSKSAVTSQTSQMVLSALKESAFTFTFSIFVSTTQICFALSSGGGSVVAWESAWQRALLPTYSSSLSH